MSNSARSRNVGSPRRLTALAALLAATSTVAFASLASAGTFVWDPDGDASSAVGGAGTWDATSLNWRADTDTGTLGAWPNLTGIVADSAVFGGTGGVVALNAVPVDINVNRITFTANGYTLALPPSVIDPAVDPNGKLVLTGTSPTIDTGAFTATITAVTLGSFVKEGSGTLILDGSALNIGGNHVIKAGTVRTNKQFGGTSLNTLNGSVNIRSGGTLQLNNAIANGDQLHDGFNVFLAGGTYDANGAAGSSAVPEKIGALIGSGTVTNTSTTASGLQVGGFARESVFSGTISDGSAVFGLRAADANSVVTLTGNNTYTGGTILNNTGGSGSAGAMLNIGSATAVGTGAITVVGANNRLDNVTGTPLTLTNNNSIILQQNDFRFLGSSDLSLGSGKIDMSGGGRRMQFFAGKLSVAAIDGPTNQQFTKSGAGTLEVKGVASGTHLGTLSVGGGTLLVDTSLMASPVNPITTGQLQIAAKLHIKGGAGATSQTFSSLAARIGDSKVILESVPGGSVDLIATAFQRQQNGATVDITLPAAGSLTTLTATPGGGVFGWATVGGNTFAVSGAIATPVTAGAITGLPDASYNAGFATATNVDATTGASDLSAAGLNVAAVNSVRFNSTGSYAVAVGDLVVSSGGVLVTSNVGANDVSITGMSITTGGGDLILIQNNPAGSLTIGATITDNAAVSKVLTKAGAGTVILTNPANTYTGKTYITNGVLQISAEGSLGLAPTAATGDQLSFNGGTLRLGAAFDLPASNRGLRMYGDGGTIDTNGFDMTIGSVISSDGFTPGTFTKAGAGKLTLTAINTANLGYIVKGGSLVLNSADTANGAINNTTMVTVDGGTLTVATTETVGYVRLFGGKIDGSAVLTASDYFLRSGDVDAVLAGGSGVSVTKAGSGTVSLNAANTHGGGTFINEGVLVVNAAGALGTSGHLVFGGGTLRFTANNSTDYSSRIQQLNGQAVKVDTNGQNVTFASAIGGTGASVTKTGTGKLTLSGANAYTGATVVDGGTLQLALAAQSVVFTGGGADVGRGTLALEYTIASGSPKAAVLAELLAGRPGNFASGKIRSSTATPTRGIGWTDDVANSLFTLTPALYGDANLDMTVNFDDLLLLAANYNQSGQTWGGGDFTYDGTVNFDDLLGLAANYNQSMPAADFAGDWALAQSLAAVPEPTALVSLMSLAAGTLVRRRARRSAASTK